MSEQIGVVFSVSCACGSQATHSEMFKPGATGVIHVYVGDSVEYHTYYCPCGTQTHATLLFTRTEFVEPSQDEDGDYDPEEVYG